MNGTQHSVSHHDGAPVLVRRRRLALALGIALAGAMFVVETPAQPKPKVVKILARRFTYSPNQITLKRGEPVMFELTTADVLMGFSVPDFGVRADVMPEQVTHVPMTPDKVGTFTFLCDIFCGSGHETMNGTIIVVA